MDFKYINSKGEIIDLFHWPYMLRQGDFFDYQWKYELNGNKITELSKEVTSFNMQIIVMSKNAPDYAKAVNKLHETFECDILNRQHGRLYVDNQYMMCYITASQKKEQDKTKRLMLNDFTITTDYPFWILEKRFEFTKSIEGVGKAYPLKYNYRYSSGGSMMLKNDHFADSDFRIEIKGECIDPEINISGSIYALKTVLAYGDRVEIDSMTGTIIKTDKYGNETNIFNLRNKNHDIFKKIPPGIHLVSWPGNFGFSVTLFEKRSEPLWT